jgi:hypothetical protein
MLNYSILSKKPSHFRNFSGVVLTEFNTLNLKIKEKYDAYEKKRLSRVNRKRAVGAGHPFKFSLTDRLLMLLVYYRMYRHRHCSGTSLTSAKPACSKPSER